MMDQNQDIAQPVYMSKSILWSHCGRKDLNETN